MGLIRCSAWLALPGLLVVMGCGLSRQEQGRIEAIEKIIEQARRNGAAKCAPDELAEAERHIELAKGFGGRSENIRIAKDRALEAYRKSPPAVCLDLAAAGPPAP